MKKLSVSIWFAAVFIIVIIFGTIYAVVQQSQRMAANSPQIQLAEDTAAVLVKGAQPAALVHTSVAMDKSLAPFTNIYDKYGNAIIGEGTIDSKVPVFPQGVLTSAQGVPYHTVTWQPQTGVRIAAVAVQAGDYYVVSGRSLTEVEKNEDLSLQLSALGGIASLIVLSLAMFIGTHKKRRA